MEKYILPYGGSRIIQKLIKERGLYYSEKDPEGLVSLQTIRKVVAGYSFRICSEELKKVILSLVKEAGGTKINVKRNAS